MADLRLTDSQYFLVRSLTGEPVAFSQLWKTSTGQLVHVKGSLGSHLNHSVRNFTSSEEPSVRELLVVDPDGFFEMQTVHVYLSLTPKQ